MTSKKRPEVSRVEKRRMRTQQVVFTIIAILVIASFVISLAAR
jgi:predicted nucleic acid-binding Zn ribbon protein